MSHIDKDKMKGAWVIMRVTEIVPHGSLCYVHGEITDSNFLQRKMFDMPVISKGFEKISPGDIIKLVYFTTKSQLENFVAKKSAGFVDTGLAYYRLDASGCWEMVYENWG